MAESSLSLTFADLQAEVGDYLGYGRSTGSWSSRQTADVLSHIKQGQRRVYVPPPLPGERSSYEWTFLKPHVDMETSAEYSTGTVAVTNGDATVTLTTGTWPTWAASGVFTHLGVSYEVATKTDDTNIELAVVFRGTTATAQAYTLDQRDYDLPDNFGSLWGDLTFAGTYLGPTIKLVGEGMIREYRQRHTGASRPRYASIRPSVTVPAGESSRSVLMLWPPPDSAYTITYRYQILPDTVSGTDFPYGGMMLAETLREACLASAERSKEGEYGVHNAAFMECLAASISADKGLRPQSLGYNGDRSDGQCDEYDQRRFGLNLTRYNGQIGS